jgi:hypothetical protein
MGTDTKNTQLLTPMIVIIIAIDRRRGRAKKKKKKSDASCRSTTFHYEILMETAVLADQSWKQHHLPQPRQTPQQRQANKAKHDRQNQNVNSTTMQASRVPSWLK